MAIKRSRFGVGLFWLVLIVLVGAPPAIIGYHAHRTGLTWSQALGRLFRSSTLDGPATPVLPPAEKIDFLAAEPIGDSFAAPPKISYVSAVDLDQDGLLDVLVCDCEKNVVSWIRQHPANVFHEQVIAADLIAPAHVEAIDFDQDGDLDLLVAVLGMLFPNNDRIGSVVILENKGQMAENKGQVKFARHVVVQQVARVSDVRGGDLDGDGDMDLAVAQFGYDDGETRWIENLGQWQFKSHMLQTLSGPIHCEIADFDANGHLDIAVLVSQEWEEIYLHAGQGGGRFTTTRIFRSENSNFGSSGIWQVDLDQDGDADLLYANGDAFDYLPPHPLPWHGVQWLENRGGLEFEYHRIADFGGAVGIAADDIDGDGDLDLLTVSCFNAWEDPAAQSMIWLENDGRMRFRRRDITNTPTHLQALALGDFDQDGRTDFVTGGMHVYEPYDRVERIMLWRNHWNQAGR